MIETTRWRQPQRSTAHGAAIARRTACHAPSTTLVFGRTPGVAARRARALPLSPRHSAHEPADRGQRARCPSRSGVPP
eukprot:4066446-Prymnesium_polylepis.3